MIQPQVEAQSAEGETATPDTLPPLDHFSCPTQPNRRGVPSAYSRAFMRQ